MAKEIINSGGMPSVKIATFFRFSKEKKIFHYRIATSKLEHSSGINLSCLETFNFFNYKYKKALIYIRKNLGNLSIIIPLEFQRQSNMYFGKSSFA